jgi:hypothetical protein
MQKCIIYLPSNNVSIMRKTMRTNTTAARAKINVQISLDTREKLSEVAALEGKKVSVLVRESIDEKITQIMRRAFEEKMKSAYQGLAKENLRISEDFKHADAENIP